MPCPKVSLCIKLVALSCRPLPSLAAFARLDSVLHAYTQGTAWAGLQHGRGTSDGCHVSDSVF
jgi:hypothetical protein